MCVNIFYVVDTFLLHNTFLLILQKGPIFTQVVTNVISSLYYSLLFKCNNLCFVKLRNHQQQVLVAL